MKIINPSYTIETKINGMGILKDIERIGRTCYKSEDKITDTSCLKFVEMLIKRNHGAMLEHNAITVRFITDRAIANELVRHRLASFAQESTRYVKYNDIEFIKPSFWNKDNELYMIWFESVFHSECCYLGLIEGGATPQEARSVLPLSTKTEIVITMNLRNWRNFFNLRTDIAAHPDMRVLTIPLLAEFKELIPIVFDDIS